MAGSPIKEYVIKITADIKSAKEEINKLGNVFNKIDVKDGLDADILALTNKITGTIGTVVEEIQKLQSAFNGVSIDNLSNELKQFSKDMTSAINDMKLSFDGFLDTFKIFTGSTDSGLGLVFKNLSDQVETMMSSYKTSMEVIEKLGTGAILQKDLSRLYKKATSVNESNIKEAATFTERQIKNTTDKLREAAEAFVKVRSDVLEAINDETKDAYEPGDYINFEGILKSLTDAIDEAKERGAEFLSILTEIGAGSEKTVRDIYKSIGNTIKSNFDSYEVNAERQAEREAKKGNRKPITIPLDVVLNPEQMDTKAVSAMVEEIQEKIQQKVLAELSKNPIKIPLAFASALSEKEVEGLTDTEISKKLDRRAGEEGIIKSLQLSVEMDKDKLRQSILGAIDELGEDVPKVHVKVVADMDDKSVMDTAFDIENQIEKDNKLRGTDALHVHGGNVASVNLSASSGLATESMQGQILAAILSLSINGVKLADEAGPKSSVATQGLTYDNDEVILKELAKKLGYNYRSRSLTSEKANEAKTTEYSAAMLANEETRHKLLTKLQQDINNEKKTEADLEKSELYTRSYTDKKGIKRAWYGENGETLEEWQSKLKSYFGLYKRAITDRIDAPTVYDEKTGKLISEGERTRRDRIRASSRDVEYLGETMKEWQLVLIEDANNRKNRILNSKTSMENYARDNEELLKLIRRDNPALTIEQAITKHLSDQFNAYKQKVLSSTVLADDLEKTFNSIMSDKISSAKKSVLRDNQIVANAGIGNMAYSLSPLATEALSKKRIDAITENLSLNGVGVDKKLGQVIKNKLSVANENEGVQAVSQALKDLAQQQAPKLRQAEQVVAAAKERVSDIEEFIGLYDKRLSGKEVTPEQDARLRELANSLARDTRDYLASGEERTKLDNLYSIIDKYETDLELAVRQGTEKPDEARTALYNLALDLLLNFRQATVDEVYTYATSYQLKAKDELASAIRGAGKLKGSTRDLAKKIVEENEDLRYAAMGTKEDYDKRLKLVESNDKRLAELRSKMGIRSSNGSYDWSTLTSPEQTEYSKLQKDNNKLKTLQMLWREIHEEQEHDVDYWGNLIKESAELSENAAVKNLQLLADTAKAFAKLPRASDTLTIALKTSQELISAAETYEKAAEEMGLYLTTHGTDYADQAERMGAKDIDELNKSRRKYDQLIKKLDKLIATETDEKEKYKLNKQRALLAKERAGVMKSIEELTGTPEDASEIAKQIAERELQKKKIQELIKKAQDSGESEYVIAELEKTNSALSKEIDELYKKSPHVKQSRGLEVLQYIKEMAELRLTEITTDLNALTKDIGMPLVLLEMMDEYEKNERKLASLESSQYSNKDIQELFDIRKNIVATLNGEFGELSDIEREEEQANLLDVDSQIDFFRLNKGLQTAGSLRELLEIRSDILHNLSLDLDEATRIDEEHHLETVNEDIAKFTRGNTAQTKELLIQRQQELITAMRRMSNGPDEALQKFVELLNERDIMMDAFNESTSNIFEALSRIDSGKAKNSTIAQARKDLREKQLKQTRENIETAREDALELAKQLRELAVQRKAEEDALAELQRKLDELRKALEELEKEDAKLSQKKRIEKASTINSEKIAELQKSLSEKKSKLEGIQAPDTSKERARILEIDSELSRLSLDNTLTEYTDTDADTLIKSLTDGNDAYKLTMERMSVLLEKREAVAKKVSEIENLMKQDMKPYQELIEQIKDEIAHRTQEVPKMIDETVETLQNEISAQDFELDSLSRHKSLGILSEEQYKTKSESVSQRKKLILSVLDRVLSVRGSIENYLRYEEDIRQLPEEYKKAKTKKEKGEIRLRFENAIKQRDKLIESGKLLDPILTDQEELSLVLELLTSGKLSELRSKKIMLALEFLEGYMNGENYFLPNKNNKGESVNKLNKKIETIESKMAKEMSAKYDSQIKEEESGFSKEESDELSKLQTNMDNIRNEAILLYLTQLEAQIMSLLSEMKSLVELGADESIIKEKAKELLLSVSKYNLIGTKSSFGINGLPKTDIGQKLESVLGGKINGRSAIEFAKEYLSNDKQKLALYEERKTLSALITKKEGQDSGLAQSLQDEISEIEQTIDNLVKELVLNHIKQLLLEAENTKNKRTAKQYTKKAFDLEAELLGGLPDDIDKLVKESQEILDRLQKRKEDTQAEYADMKARAKKDDRLAQAAGGLRKLAYEAEEEFAKANLKHLDLLLKQQLKERYAKAFSEIEKRFNPDAVSDSEEASDELNNVFNETIQNIISTIKLLTERIKNLSDSAEKKAILQDISNLETAMEGYGFKKQDGEWVLDVSKSIDQAAIDSIKERTDSIVSQYSQQHKKDIDRFKEPTAYEMPENPWKAWYYANMSEDEAILSRRIHDLSGKAFKGAATQSDKTLLANLRTQAQSMGLELDDKGWVKPKISYADFMAHPEKYSIPEITTEKAKAAGYSAKGTVAGNLQNVSVVDPINVNTVGSVNSVNLGTIESLLSSIAAKIGADTKGIRLNSGNTNGTTTGSGKSRGLRSDLNAIIASPNSTLAQKDAAIKQGLETGWLGLTKNGFLAKKSGKNYNKKVTDDYIAEHGITIKTSNVKVDTGSKSEKSSGGKSGKSKKKDSRKTELNRILSDPNSTQEQINEAIAEGLSYEWLGLGENKDTKRPFLVKKKDKEGNKNNLYDEDYTNKYVKDNNITIKTNSATVETGKVETPGSLAESGGEKKKAKGKIANAKERNYVAYSEEDFVKQEGLAELVIRSGRNAVNQKTEAGKFWKESVENAQKYINKVKEAKKETEKVGDTKEKPSPTEQSKKDPKAEALKLKLEKIRLDNKDETTEKLKDITDINELTKQLNRAESYLGKTKKKEATAKWEGIRDAIKEKIESQQSASGDTSELHKNAGAAEEAAGAHSKLEKAMKHQPDGGITQNTSEIQKNTDAVEENIKVKSQGSYSVKDWEDAQDILKKAFGGDIEFGNSVDFSAGLKWFKYADELNKGYIARLDKNNQWNIYDAPTVSRQLRDLLKYENQRLKILDREDITNIEDYAPEMFSGQSRKQVEEALKLLSDIKNLKTRDDEGFSVLNDDELSEANGDLRKLLDLVKQIRGSNVGDVIDLGETTGGLAAARSNLLAYFDSLDSANASLVKFSNSNTEMVYTLRTADNMLETHRVSINEYGHMMDTLVSSEKYLNPFLKLISGLGNKMHELFNYFVASTSIYEFINVLKQGVNIVKEFDTALVEMRKVSDESISSLKSFQKQSFAIANSVGTTALQIQQSTADWMRLGESLEEAKESAKDATILLNVSEFTSIDDATQSLVSMSLAYKELDKMEIIDKLNNIGNNYSISTDQLAEGLQNAAAVLKTQGNDIDQAIALLTAGNAITQDVSKTSAGIRTIALRISGTEEAKDAIADMGEDVDDFVVRTRSKTDLIIRDYTAVASNMYQGVSVLDPNGNLRDTYDILLDISKIYKKIQKEDKANGTNRAQALVEQLAGKNRSNIAASILNNPEMLLSVYISSQQSQGSAQEELGKYLDSVEGKLQKVTNKIQEIATITFNSESLKTLLDIAVALLDVVTKLLDTFGGLNVILGTVGGFLLQKNGFNIFDIFKDTGKTTGKSIKKSVPKGLLEQVQSVLTQDDLDLSVGKFIEDPKSSFGTLSEEMQGVILKMREAYGETAKVSEGFVNMGKAGVTAGGAFGKVTGILKGLVSTLAGVAISIAATAAISYLILQIVDAVKWKEIAIEKGKEAQKNISDIKTEYEKQEAFVDDSVNEYMELRRGVSTKGGQTKNVALSNEEYEKYLSLNKEMASLFPSLVSGYDSLGNALINLSSDTDTANKSLNELLETLRRISEYKIGKELPTAIEGAMVQIDDAYEEIEKAQDNVKDVGYMKDFLGGMSEGINNNKFTNFGVSDDYSTFQFTYDMTSADLTNLADKIRQAYINAWKEAGVENISEATPFINADNEETVTISLDVEASTEEIEKFRDEFSAQLEEIRNIDVEDVESENRAIIDSQTAEIAAVWGSLVPSLVGLMSLYDDYQKLGDLKVGAQLLQIIADDIANMDVSKLSADDKGLFIKNPRKFLRQQFLQPLVNSISKDGELNDELASNLMGLFDTKNITTKEFKDRAREYLEGIFGTTEEGQLARYDYEVAIGLGFYNDPENKKDFEYYVNQELLDAQEIVESVRKKLMDLSTDIYGRHIKENASKITANTSERKRISEQIASLSSGGGSVNAGQILQLTLQYAALLEEYDRLIKSDADYYKLLNRAKSEIPDYADLIETLGVEQIAAISKMKEAGEFDNGIPKTWEEFVTQIDNFIKSTSNLDKPIDNLNTLFNNEEYSNNADKFKNALSSANSALESLRENGVLTSDEMVALQEAFPDLKEFTKEAISDKALSNLSNWIKEIRSNMDGMSPEGVELTNLYIQNLVESMGELADSSDDVKSLFMDMYAPDNINDAGAQKERGRISAQFDEQINQLQSELAKNGEEINWNVVYTMVASDLFSGNAQEIYDTYNGLKVNWEILADTVRIQKLLDRLSKERSLRESAISEKQAKGLTVTEKDYDYILSNDEEAIELQKDNVRNARDNYLNILNQFGKDAAQSLLDVYIESQQELNNAEALLYEDRKLRTDASLNGTNNDIKSTQNEIDRLEEIVSFNKENDIEVPQDIKNLLKDAYDSQAGYWQIIADFWNNLALDSDALDKSGYTEDLAIEFANAATKTANEYVNKLKEYSPATSFKELLKKEDYSSTASKFESEISAANSALTSLRENGRLTAEELATLQEALPDLSEFTEEAISDRAFKSMSDWVKNIRSEMGEMSKEEIANVNKYIRNTVESMGELADSQDDVRGLYVDLFGEEKTQAGKNKLGWEFDKKVAELQAELAENGEEIDWNVVATLIASDEFSGPANEILENYRDEEFVWKIILDNRELEKDIAKREARISEYESENTLKQSKDLQLSSSDYDRILRELAGILEDRKQETQNAYDIWQNNINADSAELDYKAYLESLSALNQQEADMWNTKKEQLQSNGNLLQKIIDRRNENINSINNEIEKQILENGVADSDLYEQSAKEYERLAKNQNMLGDLFTRVAKDNPLFFDFFTNLANAAYSEATKALNSSKEATLQSLNANLLHDIDKRQKEVAQYESSNGAKTSRGQILAPGDYDNIIKQQEEILRDYTEKVGNAYAQWQKSGSDVDKEAYLESLSALNQAESDYWNNRRQQIEASTNAINKVIENRTAKIDKIQAEIESAEQKYGYASDSLYELIADELKKLGDTQTTLANRWESLAEQYPLLAAIFLGFANSARSAATSAYGSAKENRNKPTLNNLELLLAAQAQNESDLQSINDLISVKQAKGLKVTEQEYRAIQNINKKQIKNLKDLNIELKKLRDTAESTKDQLDYQQLIDSNNSSIASLTGSIADYDNTIKNLVISDAQALSSAVSSAMQEMTTETGLTTDTIATLTTLLSDLGSKADISDVFYATANGIKVDIIALQQLTEQQQQLINLDLESKINSTREAIEKASLAGDTSKVRELNDLMAEYILQQSQYYATYVELMENFSSLSAIALADLTKNLGANYETALGYMKTAKEMFDNGLIGTDDFKTRAAYLDPFGRTDWQTFELNYKKVERYLTDDASGTQHFLDDLLAKGLATYDALNNLWNISPLNFADSAREMGMSLEFFTDVMDRLSDYGFNIQHVESLEEAALKTKDLKHLLADAQITLEELRTSGASDEAISAQLTRIDELTNSLGLLKDATENYKISAQESFAEGFKNLPEHIAKLKELRDLYDEIEDADIRKIFEDLIRAEAEKYHIKLDADLNLDMDSYEEQLSHYKPKIDLQNRPQVDALTLRDVGWNVEGEGTGTVFTSSYNDELGRYVVMTPILPNGDVYEPEALDEYAHQVLSGAPDTEGLKLRVFDGEDAKELADIYADGLHKVQEAWYEGGELRDLLALKLKGYSEEELRAIDYNNGEYDQTNQRAAEAERAVDSLMASLGMSGDLAQRFIDIMKDMGLLSGPSTYEEEMIGLAQATEEANAQLERGRDNIKVLQQQGKINISFEMGEDISQLDSDTLQQRKVQLIKARRGVEDGSDEAYAMDNEIKTYDRQIRINTILEGKDETISGIEELKKLTDEKLAEEFDINLNTELGKQELAELKSQIESLEAPIKVEISSEQMEDFTKAITEAKMDVVADNTKAMEAIDTAKAHAEDNPAEMKINGDSSDVRTKADVAEKYASNKKPVMKIAGNNSEAINAANIAVASINHRTATITVGANTTGITNALTNIMNQQYSISVHARVSGLPKDGPVAAGTFHAKASGTAYNVMNYRSMGAYAKGTNVSLDQDEYALTNEVGLESIVRDGRWFTLPGGPHMEHLKAGDIVFNAQLTKDLLSRGRTPRYARAYASGTLAYNGMPAHSYITSGAGSGGYKPNTPGATTPTTSSKTDNNINKAANTVTDAAKKSADAIQEAIKNFQEATKNWFDSAEIVIERTSREIESLISQSELAVSTRDKNNYLDKASKQVNKQISQNERAQKAYTAQADEVRKQAVTSGLVTDQQANDIIRMIQSGNMDDIKISNYDEGVQTFIQSYKEW